MSTTWHDPGHHHRVSVLLLLLATTSGAGGYAASAASGPAYLAVDRGIGAVRFLDDSMQIVGSFATGAPLPAGVARDGERIYTLHPESQEVIAYDDTGSELFRWGGAPADGGGMALAGPHELGIRRPGTIEVRRPLSGALVRTIAVDSGCGGYGLAWDGEHFWITCGATLRRIVTGPVLGPGPLTSPTENCVEGGTALTANDLDELTAACSSGAWVRVSTADGTVLDSGNNFIDHYGLAARFEGTPVAYVAGGLFSAGGDLLLLDEELSLLAGFPSDGGNAIAVDGERIYGADFNNLLPVSTVTGYDFTGAPVASWETDPLVTGATMVGAELALTRKNQPIDFHDPESGELLHSFARPPSCSNAEALSFDGVLLWALCDEFLVGVDPQSGIELEALPNPATECAFDGLALTNPAPQRLLVGCLSGEWFLVSTLDGGVIESGNTGLEMHGIKAVRERQSGDCPGVDLLVSQGQAASSGSQDFYGGGQWPELSTALDRAARTVSVASDLEDLGHMLLFDALWLDQRGPDSGGMASLSPTEQENLAAFLDTGRRVVLVGGDDDHAGWNAQILALVGGAYAGEASGQTMPIVSHPLVAGVTSLSLPEVGTASGGSPLFGLPFASLWRGSVLTVLASTGAGSEYWPSADNEVFFENVTRWIGCAESGLLFYDGFESGDTAGWSSAVP